jgi:hypothetical protein
MERVDEMRANDHARLMESREEMEGRRNAQLLEEGERAGWGMTKDDLEKEMPELKASNNLLRMRLERPNEDGSSAPSSNVLADGS